MQASWWQGLAQALLRSHEPAEVTCSQRDQALTCVQQAAHFLDLSASQRSPHHRRQKHLQWLLAWQLGSCTMLSVHCMIADPVHMVSEQERRCICAATKETAGRSCWQKKFLGKHTCNLFTPSRQGQQETRRECLTCQTSPFQVWLYTNSSGVATPQVMGPRW